VMSLEPAVIPSTPFLALSDLKHGYPPPVTWVFITT
jgi:hypothetical protein